MYVLQGVLQQEETACKGEDVVEDKQRIKGPPLIGMRMVKTVIATAIAAALMQYVIKINPFFACIGAVVAMEFSIESSLKAALIRNVGTITGGVVGILVASFTENILLISLGIIPMIWISKAMNKKESIVPGAIVYFAVAYLNTMDQAWVYGVKRIIGTMVGTLVGLAVNFLIFPPEKRVKKVELEQQEPSEE